MWNEHVYQYCERGHSATFWAEPLNTLTNGAFILAGIAAMHLLTNRRFGGASLFCRFLTVMLFVIGGGSAIFHTFATKGAELGDMIPISIFVFSYLIFALRRFCRQPWVSISIITSGFVCVSYVANSFTCQLPELPPEVGDSSCLWGSVAYFPPLFALWSIGAILRSRSHRAAISILGAAAVFSLSLVVRTLDIPYCLSTFVNNKYIGTHFIWHCLNAYTLYILLRGTIFYGSQRNIVGAR